MISRPRLTAALEGTPAQVLALVAPAGYGKTTLARQWAAAVDKRCTWYTAGPGSSDVAALAAGIADAVAAMVPDAREDLRQRLKSTRDPEADAVILSEMLVRHLARWPVDAWLVIDDYQYIAESEIAEDFIDRVSQATSLRLLVASRQRPRWATPRKLLYGEILELNRSSLAMTPDEAAEVVGEERSGTVAGLLALAEGWPAVIGLASHVGDLDFRDGTRLPQNLHDFFAEELLHAAPPVLHDGLYRLALLGRAPVEAIKSVFLQRADTQLIDAERLGFVVVDDGSVAMHPLLRAFFFRKLREKNPTFYRSAITHAFDELLGSGRWDDAFELITTFDLPERVPELVERGLYDLLSTGRLPTLERWTEYARTNALQSGFVDLLDAEILFRRGDWAESERLGSRAAKQLEPHRALRSQAFYRAGQSAQFGDRLNDAIKHHGHALEAARSSADRSRALWGLFIAQSELELIDDALKSLHEFESSRTGSVEDELRLLGSHLTMWVRVQGLGRARELADRAARLLRCPADPVVRCGFYQMLAITLSLAGEYREALRIADLELAEANHHFLTFVLPHAYTNHALANLGLRRFQNAEAFISSIDATASAQDDLHSRLNAAALRTRLLLARGNPHEALCASNISFDRRPSPGMLADFLSTRAVALACAGDSREARQTTKRAATISQQIETRVQCAAALAIVSLQTKMRNTDAALDFLVSEVETTGNVDGLVCAYRGFPPLVNALSARGYERLPKILQMASDQRIARRAGVRLRPEASGANLTRREAQVYELLREGKTNREIAEALWISEKTAKVHVHHILEKLGARSRTEAAMKDI